MKKICFLLALVLCLSACTQFNYRADMRKTFTPLGWLKYQESLTGENSGYQLVQAVMTVDKSLQDVFDINGLPDYVRSKSYKTLNLAYLNKGEVHVFQVKTGFAPLIVDYKNFNDLSQSLVAEFKRRDNAE